MAGAVLSRLAQMLFVMFGISVLVFLIFFATPGSDPASRIAGRNAAPETLAAVRHDFGLDRPLPIQYVAMMNRLFITRDLASFVNRGAHHVPTTVPSRRYSSEMAVVKWPNDLGTRTDPRCSLRRWPSVRR